MLKAKEEGSDDAPHKWWKNVMEKVTINKSYTFIVCSLHGGQRFCLGWWVRA
jgi:hypothetical protein